MRPESPLDPELSAVELSTGPLFHSDTGAGRVVVGVHGLPATSRDFRWLDAAFAGRVRFLRLDLPGFGRSPAETAAGTTFTDLGAVVAEFVEAAGLEDAIVLGHSMGGAVAVDAATRSARIAAVALTNSSGPRVHRGLFPRTYRLIVWLADLHPLVRRVLATLLLPVARAVGFSKRLSVDEMVWAVRLCSRYRPDLLEEQLRSLDKPVLVALAEDDPAVELAVSEALVACASGPEVVRFEEGGHNLQASRAVELADAVVAWSDGPGPSGAGR